MEEQNPKTKVDKVLQELYSDIDAPLFSLHNFIVGWAVFKRVLLVSFLLAILISCLVILTVFNILEQPKVMLFAILLTLIIGSPLASALLLDWCGKAALVKHYNYRITKHIGWSIYWRSIIVGLTMQAPYMMSSEMYDNTLHIPTLEKQFTNGGLTPTTAHIIAIVILVTYQIFFFVTITFMLGWFTRTVFKRILSDETTNHSRPYLLRGLLYEKGKQHKKAIADLTMAINLAPDNTGPYYHRALTYQKNDQHEKAIRDYGEILEISISQKDFSRINHSLIQILKLAKRSNKQLILAHFRTALSVLQKEPKVKKKWLKKLTRYIDSSKPTPYKPK